MTLTYCKGIKNEKENWSNVTTTKVAVYILK